MSKRWWISKTKEHQIFLNDLFYFSSFGVSCGITSWLWIFFLWCFALMPLPFLVCLFPGLMLPVERINKKLMVFFDPFNRTGGQGSKVIANLACHSFLVSQLWGQSHKCLVGYVYVCIFWQNDRLEKLRYVNACKFFASLTMLAPWIKF